MIALRFIPAESGRVVKWECSGVPYDTLDEALSERAYTGAERRERAAEALERAASIAGLTRALGL